jgi:hypothetical protein
MRSRATQELAFSPIGDSGENDSSAPVPLVSTNG